jgi:hypothetical protein
VFLESTVPDILRLVVPRVADHVDQGPDRVLLAEKEEGHLIGVPGVEGEVIGALFRDPR